MIPPHASKLSFYVLAYALEDGSLGGKCVRGGGWNSGQPLIERKHSKQTKMKIFFSLSLSISRSPCFGFASLESGGCWDRDDGKTPSIGLPGFGDLSLLQLSCSLSARNHCQSHALATFLISGGNDEIVTREEKKKSGKVITFWFPTSNCWIRQLFLRLYKKSFDSFFSYFVGKIFIYFFINWI